MACQYGIRGEHVCSELLFKLLFLRATLSDLVLRLLNNNHVFPHDYLWPIQAGAAVTTYRSLLLSEFASLPAVACMPFGCVTQAK
jgi:hypothetical protein